MAEKDFLEIMRKEKIIRMTTCLKIEKETTMLGP